MNNKHWIVLAITPILFSCGSTPATSSASSLSTGENSSAQSLELSSDVSATSSEAKINNPYVYNYPHSEQVMHLANSFYSLGRSSFEDFNELLQYSGENIVLSPASYILTVAGISSTSINFPNEAFGLNEDASLDFKAMLEAWNFEYDHKVDSDWIIDEDYCSFLSTFAVQQVGDSYPFDEDKREAFSDKYISTLQSDLSSYHADAEYFFHDLLNFSIPVPDPRLSSDGVICYGGLKMKDYVPNGLDSAKKPFKNEAVDSYVFGTEMFPKNLHYYHGDHYEVFRVEINYTDLVIVLPEEGTNINDVSPFDAYAAFRNNRGSAHAMGYIPYFHLTTEEEDLTSIVANKMTGNEVFFDKLLADGVENDLSLSRVLQTSDFEFNEYGVSGESITVAGFEGSSGPEEAEVIELNVNRPFYAISEMDNFPIFVNKVINL